VVVAAERLPGLPAFEEADPDLRYVRLFEFGDADDLKNRWPARLTDELEHEANDVYSFFGLVILTQ
jgi:hypothetical protein